MSSQGGAMETQMREPINKINVRFIINFIKRVKKMFKILKDKVLKVNRALATMTPNMLSIMDNTPINNSNRSTTISTINSIQALMEANSPKLTVNQPLQTMVKKTNTLAMSTLNNNTRIITTSGTSITTNKDSTLMPKVLINSIIREDKKKDKMKRRKLSSLANER